MSAVTYRPGTDRDRAALAALLAGLSADSAYARFQAPLGPAPPAVVVDALLPDGLRGGSLLAWDGGQVVAHGVWVRIGASQVAEVALVVADGRQRQGIGTVLAERLAAAAGARGIERLEVFSEIGNLAVARMVQRQAPTAERARDGRTLTHSVALSALSSRVGSADEAVAQ